MKKMIDMKRFVEVGYIKRGDDYLLLSLCVIDDNESVSVATLDIYGVDFRLKAYDMNTFEFTYENNDLSINDDMKAIGKTDDGTYIFQFGTERFAMKKAQFDVFADYLGQTLDAMSNNVQGKKPNNYNTNNVAVAEFQSDVVSFINNQYKIPNDLLYYSELFAYFDKMQYRFIDAGMKIINSVGYNIFDGEIYEDSPIGLRTCSELTTQLRECSSQVYKMLYDKGVYGKTKDELLNNNEGYKFFRDMEEKVWQVYLTYCDDFSNEVEYGKKVAYNSATSNIYGTGTRLFTNSSLSAAVWSAMEYSAVKSQAKTAEREYGKSVDNVIDSALGRKRQKERQLVREAYVPNFKSSMTAVAFGFMNDMLLEMIKSEKFDRNTLNFVDYKKSQGILENISSSPNKEGVLEAAFLACPFNDAVYEKAAALGLCDIETLKTAKKYCPDNKAGKNIVDSCKVHKNGNYKNEYDRMLPFLPMVAVQLNVSEENALKYLFKGAYEHYIDTFTLYSTITKSSDKSKSTMKKFLMDNISSKPKDIFAESTEGINNKISLRVKLQINDENYEYIRSLGYDFKSFTDIPTGQSIIDYWSNAVSKAAINYIAECKEEEKEIIALQTEYSKEKKAKDDAISALEQELASLGLFAMSKKKDVKQRIEAAKTDRDRFVKQSTIDNQFNVYRSKYLS